jgi:hypothetical protein
MPIRRKSGIPIQVTRRRRAPRSAVGLAAAPPMLAVPYFQQQQTQWCWAACTQMVAAYMNKPPVQQCDLANLLHGQTNCCASPSSAACNAPCPTAQVPVVYGHLGINCLTNLWPVNAAVLLNELQQGRPVEVGYLWYAGGGHVAIVRGITPQGLYAVNDPWFGQGPCTYQSILLAYGNGGRWAFTFGGFT